MFAWIKSKIENHIDELLLQRFHVLCQIKDNHYHPKSLGFSRRMFYVKFLELKIALWESFL